MEMTFGTRQSNRTTQCLTVCESVMACLKVNNLVLRVASDQTHSVFISMYIYCYIKTGKEL